MKISEKLVAFAAIFISCLALGVSIYQTKIMQKQTHAAVWPRVTTSQSFGPDHFTYEVRNQGVGPAVISEVELTHKDTTVYQMYHILQYFAQLESETSGIDVTPECSYSNLQHGDVLGPAEGIALFSTADSATVRLALKYLTATDVMVKYCSIYDQCWKLQYDETTRQ